MQQRQGDFDHYITSRSMRPGDDIDQDVAAVHFWTQYPILLQQIYFALGQGKRLVQQIRSDAYENSGQHSGTIFCGLI